MPPRAWSFACSLGAAIVRASRTGRRPSVPPRAWSPAGRPIMVSRGASLYDSLLALCTLLPVGSKPGNRGMVLVHLGEPPTRR